MEFKNIDFIIWCTIKAKLHIIFKTWKNNSIKFPLTIIPKKNSHFNSLSSLIIPSLSKIPFLVNIFQIVAKGVIAFREPRTSRDERLSRSISKGPLENFLQGFIISRARFRTYIFTPIEFMPMHTNTNLNQNNKFVNVASASLLYPPLQNFPQILPFDASLKMTLDA